MYTLYIHTFEVLILAQSTLDALQVYAVEASDIYEQAEKVIAHNQLSDRVCVIQSKVEDLQLPENVDLIVSEWMGTMLLVRIL